MTKRTTALVLLAVCLTAFAGFAEAPADDSCTIWSGSYDGVRFRYCKSNEQSTYYDGLQWDNGNNTKVYVSWTWSFGNSKGTSGVFLEPSETSPYSAIPQGYKILTIKVERK
jgi:outer membrane receptor for ferric coprogen and ferric-rhodotorulic acid